MATYLPAAATCSAEGCGFTTSDVALLASHDCAVEQGGGHCEDFPCCGHEYGDCNGMRYGSDEAIMEREYARLSAPDYDEYYDSDY